MDSQKNGFIAFWAITLMVGLFYSFPLLARENNPIEIPEQCGIASENDDLSMEDLKECLKIYRQVYEANHPEAEAKEASSESYEPQMKPASYEPQMIKGNQGRTRGYEPQMKPASYEPQMMRGNQGRTRSYEPQM